MTEPSGATRALADFIAGSQWRDIPQRVRHEATRAILNFAGAALGGSGDEAVTIALATLAPFFGPPQARLIGRSERPDALNAAFLNAVSANVLEFDDTHLRSVIHPAAPVAPALLALAETRAVSGQALLHAFILGVEAECRIGNAVSPSHYRRGSHITATCGIFGAAAAAGKLLGLDRERMAWALGHAATQSAGLVESLGSMSKSVGVGNAARNGLAAALFAEAGLTAAEQAIEGRYGFARVASDTIDLAAITQGLGDSWEILENAYKPYPCGVVLFPVIDSCLELRERHHPDIAGIARITVRGHPLLRERTDRPVIDTGREAKVSLQHSVAIAFLDGAAGVAQYTDARVADRAVQELRARVAVEEDADIPVEAALVTLTLADGRTLSQRVGAARGTPLRPMSDAELDAKVTALAASGAPFVNAPALIAAIRGLAAAEDGGAILRLMVPG
jgi:2-methylcitrate dehydratase PrpD